MALNGLVAVLFMSATTFPPTNESNMYTNKQWAAADPNTPGLVAAMVAVLLPVVIPVTASQLSC